jgi:type II secretory pathway pseudopilin PulG
VSAPAFRPAARWLPVVACSALLGAAVALLASTRRQEARMLELEAALALHAARAAQQAQSAHADEAREVAAPVVDGTIMRGSSSEGDVQEALDAALKAAEAARPGADLRFEWTLESMRGVRGGIRGEREVVVEIRVR